MITIKANGNIDPWGLKMLSSRWELIAPTREATDDVDADGEIDFGADMSQGQIELQCISPGGLSRTELMALRQSLVTYLDQLRSQDLLVWESDSGKGICVRLAGAPKINDLENLFEVSIPLEYQPLWVGVTEKTLAGSGTVNNAGTIETPLKITIQGPVTNPSVTVGGTVLSYTGTLGAPDQLIIDTETKTVKLNSSNALKYYSGGFPQLQPGETSVIAAAGTTTFAWKDRWI